MTITTIIILVLAYGIAGAICLMVGLLIGAAATRLEQRELHEMDSDQTAVPTRWMRERDF
jgi:uncharacterized membrane-anchored protein YhcB (DUF1043 family)